MSTPLQKACAAQKVKNVKRWVDRKVQKFGFTGTEAGEEVVEALKFHTKRYLDTLVYVAGFEAAKKGSTTAISYEDVKAARAKLGFSMRKVHAAHGVDKQKEEDANREKAQKRKAEKEEKKTENAAKRKAKRKAENELVKSPMVVGFQSKEDEIEYYKKVDEGCKRIRLEKVQKRAALDGLKYGGMLTCKTCNIHPNQEDVSIITFDTPRCGLCGEYGQPYTQPESQVEEQVDIGEPVGYETESPEYVPSSPTLVAQSALPLAPEYSTEDPPTPTTPTFPPSLTLRRTDSLSDYATTSNTL